MTTEIDLNLLVAVGNHIWPEDVLSPSAEQLGLRDYAQLLGMSAFGAGNRRYLDGPVLASEAGQPASASLSPLDEICQALDILNQTAATLGQNFASLSDPDRDVCLTILRQLPAEPPHVMAGEDAFIILRTLVAEAVFCHPRHGGNRGGQGWAFLGYPGPGQDNWAALEAFQRKAEATPEVNSDQNHSDSVE
ncbi:MAG: gluconate 2-dehydrogenase subunit 3 family protein [Rhodobacteraceae bacterium]|nr:gluconate 2-dehydrogenase subunit 3 family protein [Paracoccaceae bacterium]